MKDISTLVDDIYALFSKPHTVNAENLEKFSCNVAAVVKNALEEANKQEVEKPQLRMSKIGTPDRKLWYEFNTPESQQARREIDPATLIKFLYGHILEELLLLFTREAGHNVEGEQGEVDILGVKGHRDCKIDGITTDVKSASKFAFTKFANGTLSKDDSFGYIAQISGYATADKSEFGAFLVINKESGEITLLKVDSIDMIDPEKRISHLQNNVINEPCPPAKKCYDPEPYGKSGNEVLNKNCTYCKFKRQCWEAEGLRAFRYSDGPKWFTKVTDTPRVEEIDLSKTTKDTK